MDRAASRRTLPLAVAAIAAASALAAPAAVAAPKPCRAAQVSVTSAGVRTCLPATRFRPTVRPQSPLAAAIAGPFDPPVRLTRRAGRTKATLRRVPRALVLRLAGAAAALEAADRAAARAALFKTTAERAGEVGRTRRAHAAAVTVTTNADGSVSARSSTSVNSAAGTATVEVGARGRVTNGEMTTSVDAGISVTLKDGSSVTSGISFNDLGTKRPATCPTADGAIELNDRSSVTKNQSESFVSGGAKLGTLRSAVTVRTSAAGTARLGTDAALRPFRFTVTANVDAVATAQLLAFFGYRRRIVATGRLSGTMSPSGQISAGAATINVNVSGLPAGEAAALRASARADLERMLRDLAGRMREQARDAEQKARGGGCTRLVFEPASPGDLAPKANRNVVTRLETRESSAAVNTVSWNASAGKGSVSPGSSKTPRPTWQVTGADSGPETARVTVRAVSPAGISEETWVGRLELPRTYSGTVSADIDHFGLIDSWSGTFTWTRDSVGETGDGARVARYLLTGQAVNGFAVSGNCTGTAGSTAGTIQFGDLEIHIDAAGNWTSAFVVDVRLPDFQVTCPPSPPAPYTPVAFLNSRTGAGALRPMPTAGPIVAVNTTDVVGGAITPTVASWNLQPGN